MSRRPKKHLALVTGLYALPWALLVTPAFASSHPRRVTTESEEAIVQMDWVAKVDQALKLSPDQRAKIDPILQRHDAFRATVDRDDSLSTAQKRKKVLDDLKAVAAEIKPILTPRQTSRLYEALGIPSRTYYQFAYSENAYFPTGSAAKSIFGDSALTFGVGFEGYAPEIGQRSRFGFSGDAVSIPGSNSLLVLALQGLYEYRVPLARQTYSYFNIHAGPALMDYSFYVPDGHHFDASRIGAEAGIEIGLKWGPVRLAADYRMFTEPTGISFNGFGASASLTLFRF